jgi:two-component system response regulator GlrR
VADDPSVLAKAFTTAEGGRPTRISCPVSACTLRVIHGPDTGLEFAVTARGATIGKDARCDVRLTDSGISRLHASISPGPKGFLLEDLQSRNGTEIDGVSVQSALLKNGSRILLGNTVIEVVAGKRTLEIEPSSSGLEGVVGASAGMRHVFELVQLVAPTDSNVVVRGETGTGKEVVARAIHRLSPRAAGPLVVFDGANVDRELLGSALFGHQRGAFTGAVNDHKGAFRAADGGTLFLDELGELSLDVQARLLGALQRREIVPLGSSTPCPVDVRLVAATHRNLEEMVKQGTFREDLYFRLVVFSIRLPALRDRVEDLPLLARHLLVDLAGQRPAPRLAPESLAFLGTLPWRGNVRELRNRLERALILCRGGTIEPAHLELDGADAAPSAVAGTRLEDNEKRTIYAALVASGWNKALAARTLGIGLTTLKRKVNEYGFQRPPGLVPRGESQD